MEVQCDQCDELFHIKLKTNKSGKEKETYFTCTHCGKRYKAFTTDKSIEKKQSKIRKLRKKIKKETNAQKRMRLIKKEKRIREEVKSEMNNKK